MSAPLAQDSSQLDRLLKKTLELATGYLDSLDSRPPATDVARIDPLNLPDHGLGAEPTLALFEHRYGQAMPASNGPRFWGFVTGGATPAALMGDWLSSAYDLNLSSAANSIAPNIELEVFHLLRELFSLPVAFAGTFVTGATMANFTGLALGREWVARQFDQSIAQDGLHAIPPITVLSGAAHSSIFKVLALLGLGRNSLRAVATQPDDREAVDVETFRLLAPVRLNVVCFTLAGEADSERVRDFLARVRDDGRVFLTPTVFRGTAGIRAAFSNWRTQTEDIEIAWRAMNDCR